MRGTKCDIETWRLGEEARETRGRRPPAGRHMLAWGLVVVVTLLGAPAASQPTVTDLLESLNLSGYPPGTRPPEFSGSTADGQTLSLADLRGRVVLLNFWVTYCYLCKREMPEFEHLHRDFAPQGLSVVAINAHDGRLAIQWYAEDAGLTFPLVLDPEVTISASYGAIAFPTTFLIGRDGRAVARAVGPRDWGSAPARAIIQALLAEPVAPKATP